MIILTQLFFSHYLFPYHRITTCDLVVIYYRFIISLSGAYYCLTSGLPLACYHRWSPSVPLLFYHWPTIALQVVCQHFIIVLPLAYQ